MGASQMLPSLKKVPGREGARRNCNSSVLCMSVGGCVGEDKLGWCVNGCIGRCIVGY